MRPLRPFYKFVYRSPSTSGAGERPFSLARRLWHAMRDLRKVPSSSSSSSALGNNENGKMARVEATGDDRGAAGSGGTGRRPMGTELIGDWAAGEEGAGEEADSGSFDGDFFESEMDASSHPIVAVVYTVTAETNCERRQRNPDGSNVWRRGR